MHQHTAPYRVLVTGSRTWDYRAAIWQALAETVSALPPDRELIIVHGACPTGADPMADEWGRSYGATIETHPTDWRPGGKLDRSAGPIRNAAMIRLGADICLAFIRDGSRGASHTATLAEEAGIPVRRWTT